MKNITKTLLVLVSALSISFASATAGELQFYNNSSASGTVLLSIDTPNQDDMLDPYIPDDGVIFDSNGCFASLGTGITSVTVFYDG